MTLEERINILETRIKKTDEHWTGEDMSNPLVLRSLTEAMRLVLELKERKARVERLNKRHFSKGPK